MDKLMKYLGLIMLIAVFSVVLALGLSYIIEKENGPSAGFIFPIAAKAVAVEIPIEAEINIGDGAGLVSSDWLAKNIREAESDGNIDALILRISSPGGSGVACMEIIEALESVSKPKVAWVREAAGSCAYMIAAVSDHIVAHNFSLVGGLGVTSAYVEASGFMEKYGFKYVPLVSGEFKDTGSPYKNVTKEEVSMMEDIVEKIHKEVMNLITENRNITREELANVSEGKLYLGSDAINIGLVDELGGKTQVEEYLKSRLNVTEVTILKKERKMSLSEILGLNSEASIKKLLEANEKVSLV